MNKFLISLIAGHGKSSLDGEFTHPKTCIRNEVQRLGAIGPQENNPTTGFSGVNDVVRFLEEHALFSPQFERQERQPDRQGFKMIRRFAKKVDLTQNFRKLTVVIKLRISYRCSVKIEKVNGTRKWHLVSFALSDNGLFDETNAVAYISPEDFLYDCDPIQFKMIEQNSCIDIAYNPANDPYDL